MVPSQPGSFRFFRVSGIQVYVHWSWFIIAWIEITARSRAYSSIGWNVAEYLGLFLIVLLHEFGHILACRQVGGVANEIVLWPLGGIAMGRPPPRAGAELWTIVAGPLVNVVLYPILMLATMWCVESGQAQRTPDLERLLYMMWLINKWLLIFNVLPIYPMDGGQILRSLLWFRVGRARSLAIATLVGFAGLAVLVAYRMWTRPDSWGWTLFLALFLGHQCFLGWRHAQALLALERMPKHRDFACPSCGQRPPGGPISLCEKCGNRFDVFSTRAVCPHCQAPQPKVRCVHCGAEHAVASWEGAGRNPRSA